MATSISAQDVNFGATGPVKGGQGFSVDYAFKGNKNNDGAMPTAPVIQDPAGNLYGTTSQGGNNGCNNLGCGTVFKVDSRNRETVLYAFTGTNGDGATPNGRLVIDSTGNGNLYGTTSAGGAAGLGTVFKIDRSGTETVLYSFAGGNDGASPYAGLVMDGAGDLYGTTESGGTGTACPGGCGTVFKIDTNRNETVLYSFQGGPNDGADPKAGLTFGSGGILYGTTFSGGASGNGTVFQLDAGGTETVLWNFSGGKDGGNPFGGVIRDANGVLYGTTENGGTQHPLLRVGGGPMPDGRYGCCVGIAYSLSGSNLTVLHTFAGKDGAHPTCDLALNSGVLYGTTSQGGPGSKGTAFGLTIATKTETLLHGFRGASDGGIPQAGLLMNGAGILYGTAVGGGKNQKGTVFQYKLK